MKLAGLHGTTPLGRVATGVGVVVFAGLLAIALTGHAQGTLTITFDVPPVPTNTHVFIREYIENGMRFSQTGPNVELNIFVRVGPKLEPAYGIGNRPENGTAYIEDGFNDLQFQLVSAVPFDLISVDLAEVDDPISVGFLGCRYEGPFVGTGFTTDGVNDGILGPLTDFETFHFGPEFRNVYRVEVGNHGWSLDNLVVFVPEPSALVLFFLSASLLRWQRRRTRRR